MLVDSQLKAKGANFEYISDMNDAFIIQYLQRHGISTRAKISKAIKLTQASVSKITARLIDRGIVEEVGIVSGEKGRRSVGVHLCSDQKKVIGVKLSRRNFSVGVFDIAGACISSYSARFTDQDSLTGIFDNIKSYIQKYIDQFDDIYAIGMAVPGPFLKNEGTILLITEMGDKSSENIHISDAFDSSQFGNIPIIIRHDANSGALADWWFSEFDEKLTTGTLVHFLVGEGVGAGIIEDGVIMEGHLGIAGEIGHVSVDINGEKCRCGNRGCLEMYCSSVSFVKRALEKRKEVPSSALNKYINLTASNIFHEAYKGDPLALQLTKDVSRYIGYGVVNLIAAYDPNIIIISDEMAQGGELLLSVVKDVVSERILPKIRKHIEIKLSKIENDPILYGAAAVAIDYCLKNPNTLISKNIQSEV